MYNFFGHILTEYFFVISFNFDYFIILQMRLKDILWKPFDFLKINIQGGAWGGHEVAGVWDTTEATTNPQSQKKHGVSDKF